MKILVLCQWFPPEYAPIGVMLKELGEDLVKKGHKITILTGFPNHPSGEIFGGYKNRLFFKEELNGIKIIRTYIYASSRKTIFRRMLNYLSFTISSLLGGFLSGDQEVVFSVTPPLPLCLSSYIISKFKRASLVINVQDIYPEVAITTGVLKNKFAIRIFEKLERFIYKKAKYITVISNGFRKNLISKGVSENKVVVMPNWIDDDFIKPLDKYNEFRKGHNLNNKFIILYSGTIGLISGASILLECADALKGYPDILFLFVGEGVVKGSIQSSARERNLDNMKFLPFQPREDVSLVLASADISIITLLKGKAKTSVPSKILAIMASGRPILASVDCDSDVAETIKEGKCGICVEPEDHKAIEDRILYLYHHSEKLKEMGKNARIYLEKHFTRKIMIKKYEEFFLNV